MADPKIYEARMRLARHFNELLHEVSRMYQQGGNNSVQALALYDKECPQIRQAWDWLSAEADHNETAARLLIEMMSKSGASIFHVRQVDLTWYTRALTLAQAIGATAECATFLHFIGITYMYGGNLQQAQENLRQSCRLAEQFSYWKQLASALKTLSVIEFELGEIDESEAMLNQSLDLTRKVDNVQNSRDVIRHLGFIAMHRGDWVRAEAYFQESYALALRAGDYAAIALCLNELGKLARFTGNYAATIDYQKQALEFAVQVGDQHNWLNIMMDIGVAYDLVENFSAAHDAYLQALAIARRIGAQRYEAGILGNLGYSAYLNGNFADAVGYMEAGLEMLRTQKHKLMECVSLANLIPAYLQLGMIIQAQQALHQGLELAININTGLSKIMMVVAAVQTWVAGAKAQTDPTAQYEIMESAAFWSGLVLTLPAAEQENRDEINKLIPDMESMLGSTRFNELLSHGATIQLDNLIAEIIDILRNVA